MQPKLSEIKFDPRWHLFHIDALRQSFKLAFIEESGYRTASFLDARALQRDQLLAECRLDQIEEVFKSHDQLGEVGFIFHIGHCGSTLVSRALSQSSHILPLREPLTLLTLSNILLDINEPVSLVSKQYYDLLQRCVLNAFSRSFRNGDLNIVKCASTCNNLIPNLLEQQQTSRGLCLYLTLEAYLASMLSRQLSEGALSRDVESQSLTRMRFWMQIDSARSLKLYELTPIQKMVIAWLTSIKQFLDANALFPGRLKMLDFEEILSDPNQSLIGIADFFGRKNDKDAILSGYRSVASGYSKNPGVKYDDNQRNKKLALSRDHYSDEIKSGLGWAKTLIAECPALEKCTDYLV